MKKLYFFIYILNLRFPRKKKLSEEPFPFVAGRKLSSLALFRWLLVIVGIFLFLESNVIAN